jgi:hypothetical protein
MKSIYSFLLVVFISCSSNPNQEKAINIYTGIRLAYKYTYNIQEIFMNELAADIRSSSYKSSIDTTHLRVLLDSSIRSVSFRDSMIASFNDIDPSLNIKSKLSYLDNYLLKLYQTSIPNLIKSFGTDNSDQIYQAINLIEPELKQLEEIENEFFNLMDGFKSKYKIVIAEEKLNGQY